MDRTAFIHIDHFVSYCKKQYRDDQSQRSPDQMYCWVIGVGGDLDQREREEDRKDDMECQNEKELFDTLCKEDIESYEKNEDNDIREQRQAKHLGHIVVFFGEDQIVDTCHDERPDERPEKGNNE